MAIYLKINAFFIFRPWAEQITKKPFRFKILETSYMSQGDTQFSQNLTFQGALICLSAYILLQNSGKSESLD